MSGKKNKLNEIDMCNGPIFGKLLLFSIPLMLSSILQLLFNAADVIVVGRFAGSASLAAVGSTSSLINLLTNMFLGLSVGCNVLVARYYGARKEEELKDTIHTSVALGLICGVFLLVLGIVMAAPILRLMGTPADVIDKSVMYIRIYFLGMPALVLYNFGSAILRAVGDTKRPLYYLMAAGVINVILNLIFVIVFNMDVAGVALATILSQVVSTVLVLRCLVVSDSIVRLNMKKLRLMKDKVIKILQIGLPAGIQGMIFSISNVLIQSSVNSFGSIAMAGNTAAMNVEGFVYMAMNAVYQAAITFTGQNFGGRRFDRLTKVAVQCQILVILVGLSLGNLAYLFGNQILGLYSTDATVIAYGMSRLKIICVVYCLCGMMDAMVGCIRGLGYGITPMIVSLIGACAFRVVWIFTVFRAHRSLQVLYISYPISWTLTFSAHVICYLIIRHIIRKRIENGQL